jgi:DNA polymerase III subunit epsilon
MNPKRILFLDTETTGLEAGRDRIIELGIVETIGGEFTHHNLQIYFNPPATMNPQAQKVHGITPEFLKDKGQFGDHIDEILEYIKGAHEVIIHNALFDVGFLDYEMHLLNLPPTIYYFRSIRCSLSLARAIHTRGNSLNLLAEKYGVDLSERTVHGSIIDAQILKIVFYKMIAANKTHPDVIDYLNSNLSIHNHEADSLSLRVPKQYFPSDYELQQDKHIRNFTSCISILDDLKKDFDENPYFYHDRSQSLTEINKPNQKE